MKNKNLDSYFDHICTGGGLTQQDVHHLEASLAQRPEDLEIRLKLFGYYANPSKTAIAPLVQNTLWLVSRSAHLHLFVAHRIAILGSTCRPKQFRAIRAALLEQVDAHPADPHLLGVAGRFIIWRDFETAESLLVRALELLPLESDWADLLCMFSLNKSKERLPQYKHEFAERALKYGRIALESGSHTRWLTLIYMTQSAIVLEDFGTASRLAKELTTDDDPVIRQIGNAFLGTIAVKIDDLESAVQHLLIFEHGYRSLRETWQLAKDLCECGQSKAVIQCIEQYKGVVPAAHRKQWIKQVSNGKIPNFFEHASANQSIY